MSQGPILPIDRQNDVESVPAVSAESGDAISAESSGGRSGSRKKGMWGVEILVFLVVWILLNYVVLPKLGVPT